MYPGSYEFVPADGPLKGRLVFLPRRYDAFGEITVHHKDRTEFGIYVWITKRESYEWMPNVTMDMFRRTSGSRNIEPR